MGLPRWHSGGESTCQCRRCWSLGFSLWVGKIPCSRKWKLIPVFLPRKFHGLWRIVGYSPWDWAESDTTEWLSTHIHSNQKQNDLRNIPQYLEIVVAVVQSLVRVWLFVTPWTAACQASLSFTISQSLLKLMSIESVMPSNHPILCRPLLLPPSVFPSIRGFSKESALHVRWPKYQSFSFSISPSNEYSGLISFRMDWFDLLAVQETLKSLLHHSSKASIL